MLAPVLSATLRSSQPGLALILVPCMVLPTVPTALISDRAAQLMTDAERQQFYLTAFAGGPLALLGGINGRERDGFAADPVVRRLGGEEKARARGPAAGNDALPREPPPAARRRNAVGAASLLLCAGLCGCTLPEARAAAPRCSYAALEALPERLTRVANNALAVDVRATRAIFTDERLLADPAELTTALEACTPGDATEPRKREVLAALADVREELEYQVLKGVSDPRRRDEDDATDLARSAKRARGTVQRYLDVLEARGAARLTR
mmetsp:Transcript_39835/g.118227  ORF Transcript_39835/g.118227 Transcript_39835/m.118227 type:complete len:267 (+) Transcript_39835:170-970(+)